MGQGRVATGTMLKEWFDSEEEAITARQRLFDAKRKNGMFDVHMIELTD
jgi:hypothetical protein